MLKKILIGVAVLIVLIGVGVYFLFSNLGAIIEAAIEKYGTAATQATVAVDKVTLSLGEGKGSITGLNVGNPPGFTTPRSFEMGTLNLAIDTGSITANPVVIRDVTILAPKITYERGASGGNLEAIRDNVRKYAGAQESAGRAGGSGGGSSGGTSEQPEKKVIIENLYVRDAQVTIVATNLPALGTRQLSVTLPTVHLRDIGKDKGGATPAEVASRVLGALADEAAKASVAALQRSLGDLGGAARQQLEQAVPGGAGGVQERLRGVLGR
ncbi:MAG: hypothetical protein FJX55_17275 [Alphaproteobacteria bacterium]|nr:hypothetical protein [Alphaproteobacteria bacterium]